MLKESNPQENLKFTIPVNNIQSGMIITEEILNQQNNLLISKNYKIRNDAVADRIKRLLEQNNIEVINVEVEVESLATELEGLMDLQTTTLGEEDSSKEGEDLEKILAALNIKEKDFLKNTFPKCQEKFNQVLESIVEGDSKEIDSLEPQIVESMEMMEKCVGVFQIIDKLKKLESSFYLHCYNIAITSYMIGKWLKLDGEKTKVLFTCGMVADIGLLKVSPAIRHKPFDLSDEEETEYRKHVEHSYSILENSTFLSDACKHAILCHHETVNRKGYPFQYDGNKIPLFSKIIYLAQLYCYYTQTLQENPIKAINLIRKNHLEELDLNIFYVFEKRIYSYFIGQKVKISTGKDFIGDVVMVDYLNASVLIKKEDNNFTSVPLNTFYNNSAEFV
ncbi:HD-GYP domain-containing protein [Natronincola ferrireducens]|uniref:HD-GYP domain, c-di-GMP phosphodiesterase class II (Or its inactivated variant) n=1 Tax=Natronincola ferrireducens TaxID=393762 RepID=A0A1G8XLE6_9FIRM|nr:HD domain-containing phosphohydrolase [Natronincola ferrireducens]SDJ91502.1 HD-GYP domain, c-di-GMP phosphodiesterase class II (or its inactivated variant) [Natronincola ferrireducens]